MTKKNESLFESTHHFKSRASAKRAKSAMLTNSAVLYYSIAICFKNYLKQLKRISPVSYDAQAPKIRIKMYTLFENAKTFADAEN